MGENAHIANSNHANRLPNAETNSRSNTPVKTLDTIVRVNVAESVADRHLLGSVGVVLLALHLDADDLNGLVPGTETTAESAGEDLFSGGELVALLLARGRADPALGQAAEAEAGAPVGHLPDGDGVDTLVDAADALLAVNAHEGLEGRRGLDTGGGQLVLGDFDRLHAGTEAHGGIGLGDTAGDAAKNATAKLRSTHVASVVLGFGGDEEQHRALGGSLDPGPGNETLVDCRARTPRKQ